VIVLRSIYSSTIIFISFILISFYSEEFGAAFVITSAGLIAPAIHLIFTSLRRLYIYRSIIISIINFFFFIVPSLTMHSYNKKKSVQTTIGRERSIPNYLKIWIINVAIEYPALISATILYISEARINLVMRLFLVELYVIRLPRSFTLSLSSCVLLPSSITYPICDDKSLLLTNNPSTNTYILAVFRLISTNFRPYYILFIYYSSLLFSILISSGDGLVIWAATDKSKVVSG
jgi:hypothetical protein